MNEMPERVYDDLINFIYSREADIKSCIEDFGLLQSVLNWIDYKEGMKK